MKRTVIIAIIVTTLVLCLAPILLIGGGLFFFIFGGIFNYLFQAVYYLCTGWVQVLPRLLGGFQHEPLALCVGVVALFLVLIGLHLFVSRICLKNGNQWRFRQSVAVTGILCCLIMTTISMIASIHEVYWLAHPKQELTGTWNMGKWIDPQTGYPIESESHP